MITSAESLILISNSTHSDFPIQFFCAAIVDDGQSIVSSPLIKSSAKSVILKNHCSRSFWITSF